MKSISKLLMLALILILPLTLTSYAEENNNGNLTQNNFYQLKGHYSLQYPEFITDIKETRTDGLDENINYEFEEVLDRLSERGLAKDKLKEHSKIFKELETAQKTYTTDFLSSKFSCSVYVLKLKNPSLKVTDLKMEGLPHTEQMEGRVKLKKIDGLEDMRAMLGDIEKVKYDLELEIKNATLAGRPANEYQLRANYRITEGMLIPTTTRMLFTIYKGEAYYFVFNNNGIDSDVYEEQIGKIKKSFKFIN